MNAPQCYVILTLSVCPDIISKRLFCCGSHWVLQVDRNVSKHWGVAGVLLIVIHVGLDGLYLQHFSWGTGDLW
jgi:hypothetical protein